MYDLIEATVFCVMVVAGMALAIFMGFAVWAWTGGPATCEAFGKHARMETSFDFWAGCFVTMPDGRVLEKDIARAIWKKDYKVSIGKE